MPDFHHKHLQIPANPQRLKFKGSGRGSFNRRSLNVDDHAARLKQHIKNVEKDFKDEAERRKEIGKSDDFGLILNVESAPGYPLKFTSLEKKPSKLKDGINLLNVRYRVENGETVTCASILVPYGELDTLANKIEAYADRSKDSHSKKGVNPSNADLLSNINSIGSAALNALWTEAEPLPETQDEIWWELWVSRAARATNKQKKWLEQFEEERVRLGLETNQFRLRLPDNDIILVKARLAELESSLDLLNSLTEIRKVRPCSVDLSELSGGEQHDWVDEAISRIQWPSEDAPAVCILDTGVNHAHPLLVNLLSENDLDSIVPQYGVADHPDQRSAHGTPMAGLAAYDDLRQLMLSTQRWLQTHRLESIKIIHDGNEHDPENYGAVTQEAVARPESKNPDRQRVYCLALTQNTPLDDGRPSSWSAAIDASASGSQEENNPKRLIMVSAGNHRNFLTYEYPKTLYESRIENPAQSWNSITVGAITRKNSIAEADDESRRSRTLAGFEELSPFSRTSKNWEPRWPIKPEIVMEGGNLAQSEAGHIVQKDSLELLSTASHFHTRPFTSMNATSAATASASRLAAQLMAKHPNHWPETYRGLMVHSAEWRNNMLKGNDGSKRHIQEVMRQYGFGEPHQPRLFGSGESGVTMIIEDTIQPYDPESKAGAASLGYFNLHDLPWPKDVLDVHPDVELKMKVTLSYFINPCPGSRSWEKNQKYHYASHLLRFKVKNKDESEEKFQRSLQKMIELDEDDSVEIGSPAPDNKWVIGRKLRGKAGSVVHDIWYGPAAQLSEMGQIAIFPVKGWFASRSFPEGHEFYDCHKFPVRYSLIISIDAEQEIGLYTSVSNLISIST
tara:strand:- start:570 stop:3116 length:2547 start_codon:yes stop_codon:yes gene_type:complete